MPSKLLKALRRCKDHEDGQSTKLARCLGLVDLTALGVGSTLGLGVYVLAGDVAKKIAGPAVILSFFVAAVASVFAGFCYAEFASRIPKAGSAYVYSYVTVGEFMAFTIGWNMILEYVIATASMAKGITSYVDNLFDNWMERKMTEFAPINVSFLAKYPDLCAFALVILVTVLLCSGVKESIRLNNVLTAINMFTVISIVIAGSLKSDTANWSKQLEDIPKEYRDKAGIGGFMPWGWAGVMAGAARCFFGFVGFDCVATTGEEAKNPKRDIPLAIVLSLIIIFLSYFSIATVLTLMLPYYMQDPKAPFPHAFDKVDMPAVKYLVSVGACAALCTNLLGSMFPLPRVLYTMASDGVIFRPLSEINPRTKTPLLATALSGIASATMSALFDLDQLIDMMSIGTLLAYSMVAISVLILRYKEENPLPLQETKPLPHTPYSVVKQAFNLLGLKSPTHLSATISKLTILIFFLAALALCSGWLWLEGAVRTVAMVVLTLIFLALLLVLHRQPQQDVRHLSFTVPLMPLMPCLSVVINFYLMAQLDLATWVRFIIWLIVGYLIYFFYGIKNSSLNHPTDVPMSSTDNQNNEPKGTMSSRF